MGKKKTTEKQQPQAQQQTVEKPTEKKNKKSTQKQQTASKQPKSPAKTKNIKKETKPSKPAKQPQAQIQQKPAEKVEKKPKATKNQEKNIEVFNPEFYNRVNTFQNFYREVLQLKSSANGQDLSNELSTVNTRVRETLQAASSKILKEELVTLEDWIESEQKRLREEISTVEKCLQQNQKSLQSTKAFNVDQVQNQLKPIRQRIAQKQATLDNYATLLARSQEIYQEAPQQQQKKEAIKQDEDNNAEDAEDHEIDFNL